MDNELKTKKVIAKLSSKQSFDEKRYEFSDKFEAWDGKDPMAIHCLPDLIKYLESDEKAEIEAHVYHHSETEGKAFLRKLNKKSFLEAVKKERPNIGKKLREAKRHAMKEAQDYFQNDYDIGSNLVGEDFTPLLGGPFNKQLYYTDYMKQAMSAFFAYHNDGIARRIIQTTKNFTLGRGYRVDCDDKAALAIWKAFERVNKFEELMGYISLEAPIYGETMLYWIPNSESDFYYDVPEAAKSHALIPRVKVIDPTTVWEIVTMPENFEPIYYQQIYPTQYQLFGAENAPTTKYIYQQLAADNMQHWKLNSVSNEKRGRSDLFPILGYLKRLRDTVNYKVIAEQKNAAWAIDTVIKGSQQDIQAYMDAMDAMGTIPEAGSEFVHSEAVERQYLGNNQGGSHSTESYEQIISLICAASGLPVSYLGTHIGNTGTRASAITSTEPVAKVFEMRQAFYERIILEVSRKLFDMLGIEAELEISFPEIITPDRSQKLQDLAVAESQGWFSKKRCAEIAAKELGVTDFDFVEEKADIKQIEDEVAMEGGLARPPVDGQPQPVQGQPQPNQPQQNPIANQPAVGQTKLSGNDKAGIKKNDSTL